MTMAKIAIRTGGKTNASLLELCRVDSLKVIGILLLWLKSWIWDDGWIVSQAYTLVNVYSVVGHFAGISVSPNHPCWDGCESRILVWELRKRLPFVILNGAPRGCRL